MSIEKVSLTIVRQYLEDKGLVVTRAKRSSGYDPEASDGTICEVKGTKRRDMRINFIESEFGAIRDNPGWHLLVATRIESESPRLYVLTRRCSGQRQAHRGVLGAIHAEAVGGT